MGVVLETCNLSKYFYFYIISLCSGFYTNFFFDLYYIQCCNKKQRKNISDKISTPLKLYVLFFSNEEIKFINYWCILIHINFTCRYLGYRKTINLDRQVLVKLIDQYKNGSLCWDELSRNVKLVHRHRMGTPKKRLQVPEKPKLEDYFYANPEECLP